MPLQKRMVLLDGIGILMLLRLVFFLTKWTKRKWNNFNVQFSQSAPCPCLGNVALYLLLPASLVKKAGYVETGNVSTMSCRCTSVAQDEDVVSSGW